MVHALGERSALADLSATDNPAFSKAAHVFAYLVGEVWRLRDAAHARVLPTLLAFGECPGAPEPAPDAELCAALAHALPALQVRALAGARTRAMWAAARHAAP